MKFWEKDENGNLSIGHVYEQASNHVYEFDGHRWRMWAESNGVMCVERDGELHRVKVACFANKTYGNLVYQIQRTQVKTKFNAAFIVAHIDYYGFRNSAGEYCTDLKRENWNSGERNELNRIWEVRPLRVVS